MGGESSLIRLVKTAFLYKQSATPLKLKTFYEFVPYKFGPFSFNLINEIKGLIRNGYLVKVSDKLIRINNEVSIPGIDFQLKQEIKYFINKYSEFSNKELLGFVYSHYPWFTINATDPNKQLLTRPIAIPSIYVAGYERMQVDGFLNLLLRKGIQQVIDVRANPVSRQYGYHKTTFSKLCDNVSINYLHFPELGIPSEKRYNLNELSKLYNLLEWYKDNVIKTQKRSIKLVEQELYKKPSVLLCMEADPMICHRLQLACILSENTGLDIYDLRRRQCKINIRRPVFS